VAKQKKIGILTSGGDAPGMNATIRAVVRTALHFDCKMVGVRRGFDGLLSGDIYDMNAKSVSDIIHKGGTILLTARCPEMMTPEGQDRAAYVCKVLGLDALVIIGGDGSLRGAQALAARGVNVYGIPGTIDLDCECSEYTIGFDSAVNTGMDAINKIRDTSSSHERCSVVEVMGRNCGQIALWCGMTGGAEEVAIVENREVDTESIIKQIIENRSNGKTHNLVVVAEGIGGSVALAKEIQRVTGIESRATILGHLQRGGAPTAVDRMHASMMGYNAVELFLSGKRNRVVICKDGGYTDVDINDAFDIKREYSPRLYDIMKILAV